MNQDEHHQFDPNLMNDIHDRLQQLRETLSSTPPKETMIFLITHVQEIARYVESLRHQIDQLESRR